MAPGAGPTLGWARGQGHVLQTTQGSGCESSGEAGQSCPTARLRGPDTGEGPARSPAWDIDVYAGRRVRGSWVLGSRALEPHGALLILPWSTDRAWPSASALPPGGSTLLEQ